MAKGSQGTIVMGNSKVLSWWCRERDWYRSAAKTSLDCYLHYKPGRRSMYFIIEVHARSRLQGRANMDIFMSRKLSQKNQKQYSWENLPKYWFLNSRQQHESRESHRDHIRDRDISLSSKLAHFQKHRLEKIWEYMYTHFMKQGNMGLKL